jgi:malate dehydrogenase (oxaloacetate-decarboxylating)
VAVEVAKKAASEELGRVELPNPIQQVQDAMWQPEYPQIVLRQEAGV